MEDFFLLHDFFLDEIFSGVKFVDWLLEFLQGLESLVKESLPHLLIPGSFGVLNVEDDLVLYGVRITSVEVCLEAQLFHEELDDLILRSLEVSRVIIFSDFNLNCLQSNRIINIKAFLKLLDSFGQEILLDLILGKLKMKVYSELVIVSLDALKSLSS
jgi:hypothetical protein